MFVYLPIYETNFEMYNYMYSKRFVITRNQGDVKLLTLCTLARRTIQPTPKTSKCFITKNNNIS